MVDLQGDHGDLSRYSNKQTDLEALVAIYWLKGFPFSQAVPATPICQTSYMRPENEQICIRMGFDVDF